MPGLASLSIAAKLGAVSGLTIKPYLHGALGTKQADDLFELHFCNRQVLGLRIVLWSKWRPANLKVIDAEVPVEVHRIEEPELQVVYFLQLFRRSLTTSWPPPLY